MCVAMAAVVMMGHTGELGIVMFFFRGCWYVVAMCSFSSPAVASPEVAKTAEFVYLSPLNFQHKPAFLRFWLPKYE